MTLELVGRRDVPSRCTYCHDHLADGVRTRACPECSVAVHEECFVQHGSCPTLACGGGGETRPSVGAGKRIGPRPREVEPVRRGPRPGFMARLGPYARVLVSALFHVLSLVVLLGGMGLVLYHHEASLEWLTVGFNLGKLTLILVVGVLMLFGLPYCSRALLKAPHVWGRIGALLREDEPALMDYDVELVPSGRSRIRFLRLLPVVQGTVRAQKFRLSGFDTAWWVRGQGRVWAYGLRDGEPPFLLEFESGALALLNPDLFDRTAN